MPGTTAVLDVGKTNVKLALFRDGAMLAHESRPNRTLPGPPYPHFHVEAIWAFALGALGRLARGSRIDTIVVTTHGASAALVDGEGLVLPVMDYEWEGPEAFEAEYAPLRPPFAESLTNPMPGGLNWGRQVFAQQRLFPDAFAKVRHILTYPQYFGWRLTGRARGEITSLACHSDMWNTRDRCLSRLVEACGWVPLMPEMAPAWAELGPLLPAVQRAAGLSADTRVLVGIHDSNASLLPHLMTQAPPFTVVSTGTWVIIPAIGASLGALDAAADITASVDAEGRPAPVARFMGGREWDLLAGSAEPASFDAVADCLAAGRFALPAFAPHAGPFKGRTGRLVGPAAENGQGRAALASLYLALVIDANLTALGAARGPVIVEGSFATNAALCACLAALRPGQELFVAQDSAGTAAGAALLADWPHPPAPPGQRRAEAFDDAPALLAYREAWRRLAS